MTTNARLLNNSRSGFATKELAQLDGIPDELIVHTEDEFFCSEDDAIKCSDCDNLYLDRIELDDDFRCEECATNAIDGEQHMKDLNADWSASRGCDMGRSW